MDAFKLAFETTIVGIAAFLWVAAAIDLVSPTFLARAKSALNGTNEKLAGVVLLAVAYGLGSAILPISAQLVNDDHWWLPEDAIRCRVALQEESTLNSVNYRLPDSVVAQNDSKACSRPLWNHFVGVVYAQDKTNAQSEDDAEQKSVLAQFDVVESRALGANREELFRQLRERMVVLRGAVFSGFILFFICLFGCIAPERGQPVSWWRMSLGIALAFFLAGLSIHNGLEDLAKHNIFDLPILEAVTGAVSVFGGFLAIRGVTSRPYLRLQFLVVIFLGAALSYGGWMWSEILYDQQVVTSSAVRAPRPEPSNIQTNLSLDASTSHSNGAEDVH